MASTKDPACIPGLLPVGGGICETDTEQCEAGSRGGLLLQGRKFRAAADSVVILRDPWEKVLEFQRD